MHAAAMPIDLSAALYSLSSRTAAFFSTKLRSTWCPRSSRMLEMAYLIIVGRSKLRPKPYTLRSFGSPIGSNISGRNIPLFPIYAIWLIMRGMTRNAAQTYLYQLIKALMKAENLHTWLSVGVVTRIGQSVIAPLRGQIPE
jgi:hypothetical protein